MDINIKTTNRLLKNELFNPIKQTITLTENDTFRNISFKKRKLNTPVIIITIYKYFENKLKLTTLKDRKELLTWLYNIYSKQEPKYEETLKKLHNKNIVFILPSEQYDNNKIMPKKKKILVAKFGDNNEIIGENLLGIVLMEIRDNLLK